MDDHLVVTPVSRIDTDVKYEYRMFGHKDWYNLLTTRHLETSLLRLKNKKMTHLSLSLALAGRVILTSKMQSKTNPKKRKLNMR